MNGTFEAHLQELAAQGRLRELHPLGNREGCRVERNGRPMLNLSSNDYLGLAGSREAHSRFFEKMATENMLERYGLGSASSRLLSGDCQAYHELEEELVRVYGLPGALFYNSGYHANIGVLPALCDKRDLLLSDKLNHASIHDGLRLSPATHKRYRHLDYAHLEAILSEHRSRYERAVIITESVFSMDGDVADLRELVRIKEQYGCLLYLDEAHALGLYGEHGLGKAEEQGVLAKIDLLVGPFGKACASIGSFVLCSEEIRSYLVNHSRSLIFTTALPPVTVSWNLFVLKMIRGMSRERHHLQRLSELLRQSLLDHGLRTDGSTNIVPVLIGDNRQTVRAAEALQEAGYLILPVRPPTVPEGTSRFRLSLTADMQWQDLEPLAATIAGVLRELQGG